MGRLKVKDWRYKKKPEHDPGLMAAVQMASYQMGIRKQAIRTLTINEEVQKHTQKHRYDVEDEFTDWLYGAFAIALHRKHDFGPEKIAALFDDIQELKNELISEGVDHKEIWDIVRDEVGLDIITV